MIRDLGNPYSRDHGSGELADDLDVQDRNLQQIEDQDRSYQDHCVNLLANITDCDFAAKGGYNRRSEA